MFTTVAIVFVLVTESLPFFQHVSLGDFLTDTMWTPLFAEPHYGIMPLVAGTLVTTLRRARGRDPAAARSSRSTSASSRRSRLREIVKPVLELLGAVPTVVYGYFALLIVTPLLQKIIPDLPGFNMLRAGLVIGIMIIPYVASVSEDAMRAVPSYMREGTLRDGRDALPDGDARGRAGRAVGHRGGLHPRHLARGRRDDGGRDRGRHAAEPDA